MSGDNGWFCMADQAPSNDHAKRGIFVVYDELASVGLVLEDFVVYRWSSRLGNRKHWFRCLENGLILDREKPLDLTHWSQIKHSRGLRKPTLPAIQYEYRKLHPERKLTLRYSTYEDVKASGLDRLPLVRSGALDRFRVQSGLPYV